MIFGLIATGLRAAATSAIATKAISTAKTAISSPSLKSIGNRLGFATTAVTAASLVSGGSSTQTLKNALAYSVNPLGAVAGGAEKLFTSIYEHPKTALAVGAGAAGVVIGADALLRTQQETESKRLQQELELRQADSKNAYKIALRQQELAEKQAQREFELAKTTADRMYALQQQQNAAVVLNPVPVITPLPSPVVASPTPTKTTKKKKKKKKAAPKKKKKKKSSTKKKKKR